MNASDNLEMYLSQRTKIYDMPIGKLTPYANNPRLNDEAVPAVAESIRLFGFKVPMIIDRNFVVVAGHTRLKAAKSLGLETVPCILADDLTEDEINAFRLADNKSGEIAQWDGRALLEELQKLAAAVNPIDMGQFGFESVDELLASLAKEQSASLDSLSEEEENFDMDAALEAEPRIARGEVWQIGRHFLMCGDSTNAADVAALMDGEQAGLLITDPPYGVSYESGDGMTIENDSLAGQEFITFLTDAFAAADAVMKPGAVFYIWHADSKGWEFRQAVKDTGWTVRECLIWVKNALVMGRQDYQWRHEPCLYGWKDGAGHLWCNDRAQTTVLEYDKPKHNDIHPTMKPVPLFEYQIRNSSLPEAAVLDLFSGSGTTGVACERSGRTAYLMEYDPRYAEAAIARLEQITGATARKVRG